MRLAENFKILRRNANISQEEISERLNISRQTISKWENGKSQPPIDMLVELANLFEITIDDLIRGDMAKNSKPAFLIANPFINDTKHPDDDTDGSDGRYGNIISPRISIEGINSYISFKTAYEMDLEHEKTGDTSLLSGIMNQYTQAFDQGIIEAAVNMLRILTHASMNCVLKEPDKKFPLQERVDFYINNLEEADHPAGAFYRAIHLIYRLVKNEKTDDENWDDGLILMYQLANEGNEFAIDYVEYIENAEEDDTDL